MRQSFPASSFLVFLTYRRLFNLSNGFRIAFAIAVAKTAAHGAHTAYNKIGDRAINTARQRPIKLPKAPKHVKSCQSVRINGRGFHLSRYHGAYRNERKQRVKRKIRRGKTREYENRLPVKYSPTNKSDVTNNIAVLL